MNPLLLERIARESAAMTPAKTRRRGMRPLDTSPEAERVQIEAFRRMGPEGRLKAGDYSFPHVPRSFDGGGAHEASGLQ